MNQPILSPTPTECPEGFIGNLNAEHEAKLRQMWSFIFKVYDMYDSKDPALQEAIQNAHKAASAPKPSRFNPFGKKTEDVSANAVIEKHLNLSAEGTGEEDKFGLRKQFMEMLAHHTSDSIRAMILECIKCDHPDALVLRFLRARKWQIDRALIMMFSAMDWRYNKAKVDSDIMKNGEAQAVADEKTNDIAHDFMRQIRPGKGFLHGTDRLGRPISYVRVRLHKPLAQKVEALERFIIYQIETGRLALDAPVETACLVFDMTGFTLANMDYVPVKFIIQSFEANYPESLGAILLHNSPWVFKGIWRIIHPWLDPVVASKVHFTYGREGLEEFIEPSHIIKDLGGDEDWEYTYDEPVEGENDLMKDTETRDKLLEERRSLAQKFEDATRRWIANPEGEEGEKIKAERNDLFKETRDNYWKLDPYIRARGLWDRQGNIRGGKTTAWYPEQKAEVDGKAEAPAAADAGADDDAASATQAVEDLKLSGNAEKEANVTTTSNAVAAA